MADVCARLENGDCVDTGVLTLSSSRMLGRKTDTVKFQLSLREEPSSSACSSQRRCAPDEVVSPAKLPRFPG